MSELFLAKPDPIYEGSFKRYVGAYRKAHEKEYYEKYKPGLENFSKYLKLLHDCSTGENLSLGGVPTSTFWLIDKDEVVGVLRIRHQKVDYGGHIGYDISPEFRKRGYGFQILRLALQKTSEFGIEPVIINCETTNLASQKIIERNNGKLVGRVYDAEDDEHSYEYSIF